MRYIYSVRCRAPVAQLIDSLGFFRLRPGNDRRAATGLEETRFQGVADSRQNALSRKYVWTTHYLERDLFRTLAAVL